MKRKEKESLKNISSAELSAKLRELEKRLFQMKFKRTSAPLENPMELRQIRRRMAVMRTFLGAQARAAAAVTASEVKK